MGVTGYSSKLGAKNCLGHAPLFHSISGPTTRLKSLAVSFLGLCFPPARSAILSETETWKVVVIIGCCQPACLDLAEAGSRPVLSRRKRSGRHRSRPSPPISRTKRASACPAAEVCARPYKCGGPRRRVRPDFGRVTRRPYGRPGGWAPTQYVLATIAGRAPRGSPRAKPIPGLF